MTTPVEPNPKGRIKLMNLSSVQLKRGVTNDIKVKITLRKHGRKV